MDRYPAASYFHPMAIISQVLIAQFQSDSSRNCQLATHNSVNKDQGVSTTANFDMKRRLIETYCVDIDLSSDSEPNSIIIAQSLQPLGAISLTHYSVARTSFTDRPHGLLLSKGGSIHHWLAAESSESVELWQSVLNHAARSAVQVSHRRPVPPSLPLDGTGFAFSDFFSIQEHDRENYHHHKHQLKFDRIWLFPHKIAVWTRRFGPHSELIDGLFRFNYTLIIGRVVSPINQWLSLMLQR